MKVKTILAERVFEPVTLEITFTSLREMQGLRDELVGTSTQGVLRSHLSSEMRRLGYLNP